MIVSIIHVDTKKRADDFSMILIDYSWVKRSFRNFKPYLAKNFDKDRKILYN